MLLARNRMRAGVGYVMILCRRPIRKFENTCFYPSRLVSFPIFEAKYMSGKSLQYSITPICFTILRRKKGLDPASGAG